MGNTLNVLFIADVVGRPGRRAVQRLVPVLRERYGIHICIANGENAAGGLGLTPKLARELLESGVEVLTSGNHLWDCKEMLPHLEEEPRILRPANYPPGAPGHRVMLHEADARTNVAVFCLQGRVFMHESDCPFRTADTLIDQVRTEASVILVDFHAEATSEKLALGWYLDGRVSAVVGTHTHVQTADERVLPGGTAYLSDLGMTGSHDSVIGIEKEAAIQRFLTQVPSGLSVAEGDVRLSGAVVSVDRSTGRALSITRVQEHAGGD